MTINFSIEKLVIEVDILSLGKIMKLFDNNPRIRIIFCVTYFYGAIWITFDNIQPLILKILCITVMLFGSYISLVKAKIISDKNAKGINNNNFDFFSILLIIVLCISTFSKIA